MRFGIEIECTGRTRFDIAMMVATYLGTDALPVQSEVLDDPYLYYRIPDNDGGTWRVVRDRSIISEFREEYAPAGFDPQENGLGFLSHEAASFIYRHDDNDFKVELVSPVLTLDRLPTLFGITDMFRQNGVMVNDSTGIHIHMDVPDASTLARILSDFAIEQDSIIAQYETTTNRLGRYCQLFPDEAIAAFTALPYQEDLTVEGILQLYTYLLKGEPTPEMPHPERYYALNLASIPRTRTIEFRFFNGTLDEAEISDIIAWAYNFCEVGSSSVLASAV